MITAEKPKILLLTDWFYPGFKGGGPIQSCRNFIEAMSGNYTIHVITGDRDLGDIKPYKGIVCDRWINYSDKAMVFYASRLSLRVLNMLLKELRPDFIYLNSLFSLRFTIFPLLLFSARPIQGKIVLAPRGMLHEGALRFKRRKKLLFLECMKAVGIPKHIRFHATDVREADDIATYFPGVKDIVVATNFPKMIQPALSVVAKEVGGLRCVLVSRISEKKNVLFLLEILQHLPTGINLLCDIWGEADDAAYLAQCAELVKQLPSNIHLAFRGVVNNDAVPGLLQQYHLFILPTLGENFGHAIFESFLAGRPVLLSEHTPWRGLAERKAGWDIPLRDKHQFIETLVRAANMEEAEWAEWCDGAWQLAHSFIVNTEIKRQYLILFS